MEFPIWIQIITYIFMAFFLLWIVRGVYINYLSAFLSKRKIVNARLVSKVEETYKEVKVYNSRSGGVGNSATGFRVNKNGIAYRLYFNVNGKYIELDVDKQTFESFEEGQDGILDYKGCMFYSFKKDTCDLK